MIGDSLRTINASWLSETGLTNLNSAEGGRSLVDVKKYNWGSESYPYVSGQAMRHYLREAIREILDQEDNCFVNEKGEGCSDITNCAVCDIFGYMTTEAREGDQAGSADKRVSPLQVAPSLGTVPLSQVMTVDYLVRFHRTTDEGASADLVDVEMSRNFYKGGLSLDCERVGKHEKYEGDQLIRDDKLESEDVRRDRVKAVLRALDSMTDFSKQARAMTDFTPDFLLLSLENKPGKKLHKAIKTEVNEDELILNTDRLEAVLDSVSYDLSDEGFIALSYLPGILANEEEVAEIADGRDYVETFTSPREAIEEVCSMLENGSEVRE